MRDYVVDLRSIAVARLVQRLLMTYASTFRATMTFTTGRQLSLVVLLVAITRV